MKRGLRIFAANLAWLIICAWESLLYRWACRRVRKTQEKILLRIIRKNKKSSFGKEFQFPEIKTIKDYQRLVPILTYDSYQPWISKLRAGESDVLTKTAPLILEPTSGSTCRVKLIPFTKDLRGDFLKGIRPWIFNLLSSDKRMLQGTAYWSITPFLKDSLPKKEAIPIGFKDESEYFGAIERRLIGAILAVPGEVSEITDLENFRYATLLFLARDKRLSFISIWSPTFLTNLLQALPQWERAIVQDIKEGGISFPRAIDAQLAKTLAEKAPADPKRAGIVSRAFSLNKEGGQFLSLWPKLTVISCWAEGSSEKYAERIREMFPGVRIEPKGLLATEGVVSIPAFRNLRSSLAIRSHFFEFADISNGETKLAHELTKGKTYSVVLTTGGGLYRYRLGDLIEIVGFLYGCPLIRFKGREECVSDLFGEKLNEQFLSGILERQFKKHEIQSNFFLVAPENCGKDTISYTIFIEPKLGCLPEIKNKLEQFAEAMERELAQSFHYANCRRLGQLGPFRVFLIQKGGIDSYLDACLLLGQRLGDIKMATLRKETGWREKFNGYLIE